MRENTITTTFSTERCIPTECNVFADLKFFQENDLMPEYDINSDNPLEMIWAVREKIYEETKDMTEAEWVAYVQESNDRAEVVMAKIRAEKQAAIAAGQVVKKAWE